MHIQRGLLPPPTPTPACSTEELLEATEHVSGFPGINASEHWKCGGPWALENKAFKVSTVTEEPGHRSHKRVMLPDV